MEYKDMLSQEPVPEGADAKFVEKLVRENLKLVPFIAVSMFRGSDVDDMIGEGMIGLWIAATRFDPSRGVKFCTYAAWWIKSMIVSSAKRRRRMMAQFPSVHLFQKELARLYATTGAKSCDESARQVVCNRMKISQERFESLRVAMSMSELHLEAPLFAGSDFTLADLTPGDFPTPEDECVERDRKREVAIAMKSLSDREALVMRLVMREETMDQIGKKLGVSKQRVKQINDSAFRKMRASILSHRSGFHGAAQ